MAELAVPATLALLQIGTYIPFLNEINIHHPNVQKEIKSMEGWLKFMKALMEDHDGSSEGSKTFEDMMEKIRDIAYDIEDVLEEFIIHSPTYTYHNHKISREVHSLFHTIYHRFPLRGISKKIATINENIKDFKSQHKLLFNTHVDPRPSSSSSSSSSSTRHVVSPLLLDDEMVGYGEQKNEFIRKLLDDAERLSTLAVVGPAGSGKTTFVKNIFWNRGILGEFDCHAFVHISRLFNAEELFTNMLKQFCGSRRENYPSDDGSDPLAKLRNYIAGKRFIVVLDDVWEREDWDKIRNAFPNNNFRGSRIIVTSRSSHVVTASSSDRHICELNCLESLDGWTLFCRKAFPENKGECPSELKDCSVRIVKRCEGLPFAIVAVGGALAQKPRLPNEWERFHNSLGCGGSDLSVINSVLLPSYMALSSNLKSCFLYFSIFPEDYFVERGRLIRLWVAERFVMETDDKTAEEVAEDYLNELIQRHLVHVSNWDIDGRPRNCRVLNLVLNFIIQKCKDENFASIFPRENTSQSNNKVRRLSVHNDWAHLPARVTDFAGVRSMFLLRLINTFSPHFLGKFWSQLQLLRVLDFQGAPLVECPKDIAKHTLLRYLSFRDTRIKMIPSSIKKLSFLETLDLTQTDVTELPKEISHLHSLRHLLAYKDNVSNYVGFDSVQGVKISEGISNLTSLQSLSLVKVGKTGRIIEELKKLTRLRKLGLTGLTREHCKKLCASIGEMKNLTTLDLSSSSKEECLDLGEMNDPPRTLERLYLKGQVAEFPRWISSLSNLLRIDLKWSKMQHSPLEYLESLPNLMELQLVDSYIGDELIFKASHFKKLKILLMEELSNVHTIVIQDGAMPDLKQMSIRRCPKLMMFPLGINNLTKVEELTLYDMAEFVARFRKNGEERDAVRHIPLIHSFTLANNQSSWPFENLSDSFSHSS